MDQVEIRNPNEDWVASDNVYPMMLYRAGSEIQWDGKGTDTKVVADSTEHATAIASGWAEGADYAAAVEELATADKTAKEIEAGLADMSLEELEKLKVEETEGKARKGVLAMIDAAIDGNLSN